MVRTKNTKNLPQYSASVLCEHCSEKFISNDVKENHVNEEHLAKIVKLKMKCDFCEKTFSKLTRRRLGFCYDTDLKRTEHSVEIAEFFYHSDFT